jgi:hypothetical protein
VKIKEEKEKCKLCGRHSNCYWVEVRKEKKRWSLVKGSNSLDEKIENERTRRKKDRGKISKRKKPLLDDLEHRVGRKERQAGEALETWVRLT